MDSYEEKLKQFLGGRGHHLTFETSCHSVADAAKAASARPEDFVKNVCMVGEGEEWIVAIVKGEDNASGKRVGKALGIERPRLATPEEILEKTGFPCGGTPSFGFQAIFLIDPRVMERKVIYTGGGSQHSLVRIETEEMLQLNSGQVVRIRR